MCPDGDKLESRKAGTSKNSKLGYKTDEHNDRHVRGINSDRNNNRENNNIPASTISHSIAESDSAAHDVAAICSVVDEGASTNFGEDLGAFKESIDNAHEHLLYQISRSSIICNDWFEKEGMTARRSTALSDGVIVYSETFLPCGSADAFSLLVDFPLLRQLDPQLRYRGIVKQISKTAWVEYVCYRRVSESITAIDR